MPAVSLQSQENGGRLRIAHLTTVDMSLALLLATELSVDLEAGHEVFGVSAPGPYVDRVAALGIQHVPIETLTRHWDLAMDARAFVDLTRALRRLKLDVLHTHNPKTGIMGRIAGRLVGVPVVVNTCHGLWARAEDPLLKRLFVYGAEALAIRFSDFELFQNAEDAKTLRRFLKRGSWLVVGNGIDLDRFQPDLHGRARVRAEWGIRDDQLVVGTIGRRVREKGLAEFAEAARQLGDRAVFVWVGPEDATDAAAQVPRQDAIRFVGERSDMPAIYSALDIFALATYREGFSRASMEAAACGLPMVLSDIRGCREIGAHDEHLLLAQPRDAAALTSAVGRLIEDQDLRVRLGATARERALANFDQREVAARSLAVYGQVAGRPRVVDGPGPARLKVLHVLPDDQSRGAHVHADRLRDHFKRDVEHEHLLVTLFDSAVSAARPDLKLAIPSALARRVLDLRALRALRRVVRDQGVDIVVAHGSEALKYVIPAAGDRPTVYYKLGLSTSEASRSSRRLLYTALARRATYVVGVSKAIIDEARSLFGLPANKVSVIPDGRDPEIYRPSGQDEEGRTRPHLLWVGTLEPGKQPELFVRLVSELRNSGHEFDATMIGDGPLRTAIEPEAAAAGVALLGRRDDVPDLMRRATVLVMTSAPDTEGMPGVLIEAGLSAVAVVAPDAPGVRDVVRDSVTGYVAEVGDNPSPADRVATLLDDPALATRMGQAARQHCLSRFTIKTTAGSWRTLSHALVQGAEPLRARAAHQSQSRTREMSNGE